MAAEILLLVISCGAIAAGWGYVRTARCAKSFKTTRGTVVGREIAAIAGGSREGRWGRGGGYRPKVTYTYVVDGVTHTSDRWSHATEGLKRIVAERTLAAVGPEVDVHYDPQAPADAYLRLPRPQLGYALLVGGAVGVIASAVALFG